MMNFKPTLKAEITYDSVKPEGYEYESRTGQTSIKYNASLITRDWGFCVSLMAPEQTIEMEVDFLPDNSEDYENIAIEIKLSEVEVDMEDRKLFGDICPKDLEITLTSIKMVGNKFQATGTAKLIF